ncbi:MAG: hypothetical protein GY950_20475 [bacterium]|nr:hypothetical protein [bacterium]
MKTLTLILFIVLTCAAGCNWVPASEYEALEKDNQTLRKKNLELFCEVMVLKTRVFFLEESPILVEKRRVRYIMPEDYGIIPGSRFTLIPKREYGPRVMFFVLSVMFPWFPSPF